MHRTLLNWHPILSNHGSTKFQVKATNFVCFIFQALRNKLHKRDLTSSPSVHPLQHSCTPKEPVMPATRFLYADPLAYRTFRKAVLVGRYKPTTLCLSLAMGTPVFSFSWWKNGTYNRKLLRAVCLCLAGLGLSCCDAENEGNQK